MYNNINHNFEIISLSNSYVCIIYVFLITGCKITIGTLSVFTYTLYVVTICKTTGVNNAVTSLSQTSIKRPLQNKTPLHLMSQPEGISCRITASRK